MAEDTATAPVATDAVGGEKSKFDSIIQQMMGRMQHPSAQLRQPQPRYTPGEMQQGKYMMGEQGSKKGEVGASLANFGTFIHNAVAQHKQRQVQEAMSEWEGLNNAYEKAQVLAGDPSAPDYQQKVMQMLQQDPYVKANLDPANPKAQKRLKNMYKALNVDITDDKQNVHREGLKRFFQAKQAFSAVKSVGQQLAGHKQQQQQMPPEEQSQRFRGMLDKLVQQSSVKPTDPKDIEAMARILEARTTHEDAMAFRKQAHLDALNMQQQGLDLRRQQLEESHADRQANLKQRAEYEKEMLDLRRQEVQIRAEKAHENDDVSGLKEAVEAGFPINMISPKHREAVVKQFTAEGHRVPTPISQSEQTTLDDASTQIGKLKTWKSVLETLKDPSGKLSNSPMAMLKDRIKYAFGQDTMEGSIISDFSRERWAAISGLVKGVRRGDILQDMVKHTPQPWIDSVQLMHTKLDALEANYSLARAVVLKDHGFTRDPLDGSDLDTNIKSYDEHLASAKAQIQALGTQQMQDKAKAKGLKVITK